MLGERARCCAHSPSIPTPNLLTPNFYRSVPRVLRQIRVEVPLSDWDRPEVVSGGGEAPLPGAEHGYDLATLPDVHAGRLTRHHVLGDRPATDVGQTQPLRTELDRALVAHQRD